MGKLPKIGELSDALKGIHEKRGATGGEMYIDSIEGLSTTTIIELFRELMGGSNQANCSCRFRIGDIYRMLGNGDPAARNAALEKIRETFNEQERQNLRTWGWVAGKWPRNMREGHGWAYYLNNEPGNPLKVTQKRKSILTSIDGGSKVDDGDLVVECQDFSGRRFVAIVKKRELSVLSGSGADTSVEDREGYDAFAEGELVEA